MISFKTSRLAGSQNPEVVLREDYLPEKDVIARDIRDHILPDLFACQSALDRGIGSASKQNTSKQLGWGEQCSPRLSLE